MSDEISTLNQSITPTGPEVITIAGDPIPPKHPLRVAIIAALITVLFFTAVGGWWFHHLQQAIAMGKAFKMPPDAVTSLKVTQESVSPVLESVGSLASPQGVMLSADLPGTVTNIAFESGTTATNGQLLVQIDTRQEEAQLATAKAKLDLARLNLDRARDLSDKRVIATSAYDENKSGYDVAVASVEEMQAAIDRKTIRAPFGGVLGIRQINVGQYLKSGDAIVQLESLDPIYVNFALPQQYIGNLKIGQPVKIQADGLPGKKFAGTITAINSLVDSSTRNIQVQGTIPNPDHLLRSGMFAGVQVELPTRENVVLIPSTSVQYAPYGDSVFVIETMKGPDGVEYLGVREQPVTLGKSRGDQIEILSGLNPGDEIATSGIFKLHPGGGVKINNSVQPGNNPAPKPEDS